MWYTFIKSLAEQSRAEQSRAEYTWYNIHTIKARKEDTREGLDYVCMFGRRIPKGRKIR